ncbi:MAG: ATP-dependent zinc metalloprotease FtsH [Anaerolineae bacterium]|nr:ATP-dependent zinc metalloprotease FtsH [Anaerolineae bacterium]
MQNRPTGSKPDRNGDNNDQRPKFGPGIGCSLVYILLAFVGIWLFQSLLRPIAFQATEVPYSAFKQMLEAGRVREATIGVTTIRGAAHDGSTFTTIRVDDPELVELLDQQGVAYAGEPPESGLGAFLLSWIFPIALIGVMWYFLFFRRGGIMGGGGGGIFNVGRSRAQRVESEHVDVNFKDVGGADEAIEELQEIIQFLKKPEEFQALGGQIPKGVILVGPPGTGKTLIAKATAGEAGVPFFETSGSEFVEMFVGVGAARVRDLFEQARKEAPAIIFIDEIDAIGRSRGGLGSIATNDEREQTLNQLLAEIDGFDTKRDKPVIIMAATNRPEVLDPALMRAGRFDRQVVVNKPDLEGRKQILRIHARDIKLSPDFDIERAARITPGFSGADLENVINQAALLAARRKASAVEMRDFEEAIERVVAGLERRSTVMNDLERETVAYHEAGHALVAESVPTGDPVAKISIIPRGKGALGYTLQMPTEDRYLLTRDELLDRLAIMLGGRAAEEVVFGRISTGAVDDIQRVSEMARRMVTEFGMSERLGLVRYAPGEAARYLELPGMETSGHLSPETKVLIDEEVRRIVDEQYERAKHILVQCRDVLDNVANMLLEHEVIGAEAIHALFERRVCREPDAVSAEKAAAQAID